MPKKWNFLSNYGLVLTHLFQNPRATLREIARGTDLTERAVYQIVRELEEHTFIQKRRVGPAPSMAAASMSDFGTDCSPARKNRKL